MYRIGMGFDSHKFGKISQTRNIKLGGIDVEFDRPLIAHSDGDVILHALVDAMFGSIAAGDIGMHFPPNDEKWRDVNSAVFVKYAYDMIKRKSAIINNIDITFIGERPKISKYRDAIQANIAHMLDIDLSQVNVKATTTEKMGFTGREEGIASQVVILIKLTA